MRPEIPGTGAPSSGRCPRRRPPGISRVLPSVEQTDAYWEMKKAGAASPARCRCPSCDLHLPRNTPVGIFMAFFAVILGFALIWRIDWLAAVGLIGAVAVALRESWKTDREDLVPAQEVAAFERAHGAPERHLPPAVDFDALRGIGHDRAPRARYDRG